MPGSMGYACKAVIGGYYVLLTSESIRLAKTPIQSSGATGRSSNYAGKPFKWDFYRYAGSISFQLSNQSWNIVEDILDHAKRHLPMSVITYYSSNETRTYTTAYWTDFSMEASEGGVVECTLGILAFQRDDSLTANTYYQDSEITGVLADDDIVPYWNTTVDSFSGFDVLSWNFNINNNVKELQTCQKLNVGVDGDSVIPENVVIGDAEVTFAPTLWGPFSPSYEQPSIEITVGSLGVVTLKDLFLQDDGKGFQGKNQPVTFSVSYNASGSYPIAA